MGCSDARIGTADADERRLIVHLLNGMLLGWTAAVILFVGTRSG